MLTRHHQLVLADARRFGPFSDPLKPITTSLIFHVFFTISTLSSVTSGVDVGDTTCPAFAIVSLADDGLPSDAPVPGSLNTTFTVNGCDSTPAFFTGTVTVADD